MRKKVQIERRKKEYKEQANGSSSNDEEGDRLPTSNFQDTIIPYMFRGSFDSNVYI